VAAGVNPKLGPLAASYVLLMAVLGPLAARFVEPVTRAALRHRRKPPAPGSGGSPRPADPGAGGTAIPAPTDQAAL
jgi:monovalent cation:H+ antiporter-2, CPA2 family